MISAPVIQEGVELPVSYYAGGIRDRDVDEPELIDHEVMWGGKPATPAAEVWAHLHEFERSAQEATLTLDAAVPAGGSPSGPAALYSVLALADALHNEWVRIHPYVNANGRCTVLGELGSAALRTSTRCATAPPTRERPLRPRGGSRPSALPWPDATLLPLPTPR